MQRGGGGALRPGPASGLRGLRPVPAPPPGWAASRQDPGPRSRRRPACAPPAGDDRGVRRGAAGRRPRVAPPQWRPRRGRAGGCGRQGRARRGLGVLPGAGSSRRRGRGLPGARGLGGREGQAAPSVPAARRTARRGPGTHPPGPSSSSPACRPACPGTTRLSSSCGAAGRASAAARRTWAERGSPRRRRSPGEWPGGRGPGAGPRPAPAPGPAATTPSPRAPALRLSPPLREAGRGGSAPRARLGQTPRTHAACCVRGLAASGNRPGGPRGLCSHLRCPSNNCTDRSFHLLSYYPEADLGTGTPGTAPALKLPVP